MKEKLPGVLVRSGLPRVMRSALSETWYVISPPYRDMGQGRLIAERKREVHPDDAKDLEILYRAFHGEK